MSSFRILGLMSGTSLDGLDIVDVLLKKETSNKWSCDILHSKTVSYPNDLFSRLSSVVTSSALELALLNHDLGVYFGECVIHFMNEFQIDFMSIHAISSHGHTVFHQPEKGLTVQIGNGPELALTTGIKTVCDFRVQDVLLGGNGAPLVPVGDQLLFSSKAESFLNLGGFSNISFSKNGSVKAFDICPVNVVLNKLSELVGKSYDAFGKMGRSGQIDLTILEELNNLSYYKQPAPKSLGVEWVSKNIAPIIKNDDGLMTTFYEHVAIQLAAVLRENELKSVLVTGGGAKNTFLIERLKHHYSGEIIIPDEELIDFKEAVVFALLGALRLSNEVNVWCSVTGARKDSISGVIHNPSL
jgi:anhydro-N-acetylmuramic acid kinase